MNYLNHDNSQILVAVSTEGYIAVWSIEALVAQMDKLDNKLLDLGDQENFEAIYRFEINSRIITCASRLNFVHGVVQKVKKVKKVENEVEQKEVGESVKRIVRKGGSGFGGKGSVFRVQNKLRKLRKFKNLV